MSADVIRYVAYPCSLEKMARLLFTEPGVVAKTLSRGFLCRTGSEDLGRQYRGREYT